MDHNGCLDRIDRIDRVDRIDRIDRISLRRRIAELTTPDSRARDSLAITDALLASSQWQVAHCVFCYISVGNEVSTTAILQAALDQGKRLCVPRILVGLGLMEAAVLDERDVESLTRGKFGIPSPSDSPTIPPDEIDLAIVPGLAFDYHGARVGQGGGYYDRYLERCGAYRVAPAFKCQVLDYIAMNPWDQRVHALALPDGLHVTGVEYEPKS